MEQTLLSKDIIRIYHKKKGKEKTAQLTNNFFLKKKKKKIQNKMAFYISNDTILYKIRHFLVCLLQCLFLPFSLHYSFFPWYKTEYGHGETISVLKYIYIYNFSSKLE